MMWRHRFRGRTRRARPAGTVPLAALRPGERAEVVAFDVSSPRRLQRLSTLGLVPGVELVLRQIFPAYVVGLGETELALDCGRADEILVRRLGPARPIGGARWRRGRAGRG